MAISLEQFQSQIAASELLKQEEVSAFISAFPEDKRPKSAEELARELVRQKRLTKYQAEQIYALMDCARRAAEAEQFSAAVGAHRVIAEISRHAVPG